MKNYARKKALTVSIAITLISVITVSLVYMLFTTKSVKARNAVAMSSGISACLEEKGNGHRHYKPANNNKPLGTFPPMQPGDVIRKQPRVRRDDNDPDSAIPAYVRVYMDIDVTGLGPDEIALIGKILGCVYDISSKEYVYSGIYDASNKWVFVPNDPPDTGASDDHLSGVFYYVVDKGKGATPPVGGPYLDALYPEEATAPIFTHINVPSGDLNNSVFTVEDLELFAEMGGKGTNIADFIKMTFRAELIQSDNNPYNGREDKASGVGYESAFSNA